MERKENSSRRTSMCGSITCAEKEKECPRKECEENLESASGRAWCKLRTLDFEARVISSNWVLHIRTITQIFLLQYHFKTSTTPQ